MMGLWPIKSTQHVTSCVHNCNAMIIAVVVEVVVVEVLTHVMSKLRLHKL